MSSTPFNKVREYIELTNKSRKVSYIHVKNITYYENHCDCIYQIVYKNGFELNHIRTIYYNDLYAYFRKQKLKEINKKTNYFYNILNKLKWTTKSLM